MMSVKEFTGLTTISPRGENAILLPKPNNTTTMPKGNKYSNEKERIGNKERHHITSTN